jgi:hypothetical protein
VARAQAAPRRQTATIPFTGAHSMAVTYSKEIRPLFRPIDVDHMKPRGVLLDDVQWMTAVDNAGNHANADNVFSRLADGSMPPDEAWSPEKLDLYGQWMNDGYQP